MHTHETVKGAQRDNNIKLLKYLIPFILVLILIPIFIAAPFIIDNSIREKNKQITLEEYVRKYENEDGSIFAHILFDNEDKLSELKDQFITIDIDESFEIMSGDHLITDSFIYVPNIGIDIAFTIKDSNSININVENSIIIFNKANININIQSSNELDLNSKLPQINIEFNNSIFIDYDSLYALENIIVNDIFSNSLIANELIDPIYSGVFSIEGPIPSIQILIYYYVYLSNELPGINIHSNNSMIFESFNMIVFNSTLHRNPSYDEIILSVNTPVLSYEDNFNNSLLTINNWPKVESNELYYEQYKGIDYGEGSYIDVANI